MNSLSPGVLAVSVLPCPSPRRATGSSRGTDSSRGGQGHSVESVVASGGGGQQHVGVSQRERGRDNARVSVQGRAAGEG